MNDNTLGSVAAPVEMSLEEKLAAIEMAIKEANGDPKKEAALLLDISDPQDSLNCEGCQ